jgi:hypothetical protein
MSIAWGRRKFWAEKWCLPDPADCGRRCPAREAWLSHPPALRVDSAFEGRVGEDISCAVTMAANVLGEQEKPQEQGNESGQKTPRGRSAFYIPAPLPPAFCVQELWAGAPAQRGPSCGVSELVSPTRPPCGLARLLRGGWVGIFPAPSRWRPMCLGSKRSLKNRATSPAKRHPEDAVPSIYPLLCRQRSACKSYGQGPGAAWPQLWR